MKQNQQATTEYREVQRFTQKWLWILLLLTDLAVIGLFAHALYVQLILGQPWGNRPQSDTALLITAAVSILLMLGMTYLFARLRLITEVRQDGLFVQFPPLRAKEIAFSEISSCRARTYKPIREYGGWGIRYGRRGKAYNVSGNKGVQLEFHQGKALLIGSQRAEKLAAAINARL